MVENGLEEDTSDLFRGESGADGHQADALYRPHVQDVSLARHCCRKACLWLVETGPEVSGTCTHLPNRGSRRSIAISGGNHCLLALEGSMLIGARTKSGRFGAQHRSLHAGKNTAVTEDQNCVP